MELSSYLWYNILGMKWSFAMKILIDTQYITLGQLLKITDFISSGGQAKIAVKSLSIFVNDDKEDRRGRKLYQGDIIVIENSKFIISCN